GLRGKGQFPEPFPSRPEGCEAVEAARQKSLPCRSSNAAPCTREMLFEGRNEPFGSMSRRFYIRAQPPFPGGQSRCRSDARNDRAARGRRQLIHCADLVAPGCDRGAACKKNGVHTCLQE